MNATTERAGMVKQGVFGVCVMLLTLIPVSAPAQPAPSAGDEQAVTAQDIEAMKDNYTKENLRQMGIPVGDEPVPIVIGEEKEPLDKRMQRTITLDVREMAVIDVLKFLALKGDFNLVTASTVQGRATFYLKRVTIQDALDIAILSNRLAYTIENNIVRIFSEAEYEALYGKRFNDRKEIEIIQLNYAKPSYVLAALDNIKSSLGRIIIDEDTGSVVLIDTREAIDEMKKTILDMERPLANIVYTLQYAKADVVAEKLRARIDAHSVGSITVDERTNKLIVRAFPDRREEVEKLIESLDVPTMEVLIEARVLQIVFKPQYDFGIDWDLDFRDSANKVLRRTSFQNVFLDESNLSTSSNLFTNFSKLAIGDFSKNQLEVDIRALQQVSDTRILSNPKLLVTNNQEAKIHVGDTVPYIISTTSGTGDNAITSEDVRFVDVGIKLNVTPTINEDGYVTMLLNPEISTVTTKISSQGGGIPQVNKTEVETAVIVKNGQTVILGGLKKDNKVLVRKGIPFLMNLPLLGGAFGSTSEEIEATEIVIFITPHIVTGDHSYKNYKGDIKPANDYGMNAGQVTPYGVPGMTAPDAGQSSGQAGLKIKD